MQEHEEPVTFHAGTSGDPLLKRLVSLATLGWSARLVLLTNGTVVLGTLVSPTAYREALAKAVALGPSAESRFEVLDKLVAEAIIAEDGADPLGSSGETPEPRFVHLADVQVRGQGSIPFLRLRLPAVSGFWLTSVAEPASSEPISEGR